MSTRYQRKVKTNKDGHSQKRGTTQN